MLHFIFGELISSELHFSDSKTSGGYLVFERARVRWFLSIDSSFLPTNAVKGEKLTYRSITVSGKEIEFSGGFTELHNKSYENILHHSGFGLEESRVAVEAVEKIRLAPEVKNPECYHPMMKRVIE